MRRSLLSAGLAGAFALSAPAAAEPVTVVASIKPVHSLVAGVMQGVGTPHLIVKGGGSPHTYSLKPSDAAALEGAKLVVWVGAGLEPFLETAVTTLGEKAAVLELAEAPGLTLHAFREGGPWEEDSHEEEAAGMAEHHDEEAHAEEEHAEEDHAGEAHGEEEHHEADGHGHGEVDQHIWLDPDNAKVMVAAIADALARVDPDNRDLYRANAENLRQRLDQLTAELTAELAPVKNRPFIVFHDAFQYLDVRFGLRNVGSITVNPDRQPGATRLREIQEKIEQLGALCVFIEPQFEPRLVQVVIEGTEAKTGTLDPEGADIADGPELYFELLRRNAAALKACLGEAS